MMRFIAILFFVFIGCSDDIKIISDGAKDMTKEQILKQDSIDAISYKGLEDVYQDTKYISPNGKYLFITFGVNGCFYCEKLKNDIKKNPKLRAKIKDNFNSFYVNLSYSKMHILNFNNKDTHIISKDLGDIYDVLSTPTLVFASKEGKTILNIPGYINPSKFLSTIEFIKMEEWKDKTDKKAILKLWNDFVKNAKISNVKL